VSSFPQPFFDQIGITNVVWFDDLFEPKTSPTEVTIVDAVGVSKAIGTLPPHPKLADLSSDDSPQEWAKQILARMTEGEIAEYLDKIKPPYSSAEEASDYTPGEVEQVISSLGTNVQRLGLSSWPDVKEAVISAGTNGVFLVDRERIRGNVRMQVGDEIVKELVERCPQETMVIVLTHSVGPEGTEALRKTLARELDIPIAKLGTVSKRPASGSLTNGIRAAVRVTSTQLTCSVVMNRIVAAMSKALDSTREALSHLPVLALDRAIFENSFTEGASEIDVLCRILLSRQRTAIDADIAGALDEVHSPLARMRKLRLLEKLPELPVENVELIREWRRDEVFDIGERLNALRAPLVSGDVFLKDKTKRYYVLLGQPCDLMVRNNGHRSAEESAFVRLVTSYEPAKASEGRFFEVPALEGTARWALDFRDWYSVKLECLEWVSFNNEGRVFFSPTMGLPTGLLPGWEKRFESAQHKFSKGKQYCLSIGNLPCSAALASDTTIEFPYRRVARLRSPRSEGAYAAFLSFQARSAFDHDFAKGIS
jgi:hypothetical protein